MHQPHSHFTPTFNRFIFQNCTSTRVFSWPRRLKGSVPLSGSEQEQLPFLVDSRWSTFLKGISRESGSKVRVRYVHTALCLLPMFCGTNLYLFLSNIWYFTSSNYCIQVRYLLLITWGSNIIIASSILANVLVIIPSNPCDNVSALIWCKHFAR